MRCRLSRKRSRRRKGRDSPKAHNNIPTLPIYSYTKALWEMRRADDACPGKRVLFNGTIRRESNTLAACKKRLLIKRHITGIKYNEYRYDSPINLGSLASPPLTKIEWLLRHYSRNNRLEKRKKLLQECARVCVCVRVCTAHQFIVVA